MLLKVKFGFASTYRFPVLLFSIKYLIRMINKLIIGITIALVNFKSANYDIIPPIDKPFSDAESVGCSLNFTPILLEKIIGICR